MTRIEYGRGEWLSITALVVDDDVDLIIRKNIPSKLEDVVSHSQGWVEVNTDDGRVRLNTTLSKHDGHSSISSANCRPADLTAI